jgi:hypothetical protein
MVIFHTVKDCGIKHFFMKIIEIFFKPNQLKTRLHTRSNMHMGTTYS